MSEQHPSFQAIETRSLLQTVRWERQPLTHLDRRELLTQLAIPGGIHSCFLTTALNGGIVTGNLSPNEAAYVQRTLTTSASHRDKWGERDVNGQTILVWQTDLSHEVQGLTGKSFPFRAIHPSWCQYTHESLPDFLADRLAQGYALSWGDEIHQRLAVGISIDGNMTGTVDPYAPLWEETAPLSTIAQWHRPSSPIAIIGNYTVLEEQEIVRHYA